MTHHLLSVQYFLLLLAIGGQFAACWAVLWKREFFRHWRIFSFYLFFMATQTVVSLAVYRLASANTYALVYYAVDFIEAILLNLVVLEILVKVLDPFEALPGRTVARFCFWAVLGTSLAVGLSVTLPAHTNSVMYDVPLTIERTIFLADAALLWVLLLQSKSLGITWKSCHAEIAAGFIVYLTVQATTRFVLAIFKAGTLVAISSAVGQVAYLIALSGWIWTILHRDPSPAHPSPESLAKLQELADQFNLVPKERIFAAVGVKIQRPDPEDQETPEQEPQTS